jgi:hypothetical protein
MSNIVYDKYGNYRPNLNGALDENNCARIWTNSKGQRHREDGAAVEYASGSKFWFINGERHREDGPAVEWLYGRKSWYINGIYFSKDEWLQYLKSGQSSLDQKTILKLILENS